MEWSQKACAVGAEKVALYLMYIGGLTGWPKTPLKSGEMERFGLWPKTSRLQLTMLEEAGLVRSSV